MPEPKPFLKICTLCGCLNTRSVKECACCGWQGLFLDDPAAVKKVLSDLYPARDETLLSWFRKVISG